MIILLKSLILESFVIGFIIGMLLILIVRIRYIRKTKNKPKEYSHVEAKKIDLRDQQIINDSKQREQERRDSSFGFSEDLRMK